MINTARGERGVKAVKSAKEERMKPAHMLRDVCPLSTRCSLPAYADYVISIIILRPLFIYPLFVLILLRHCLFFR